MSKSTRWVVVPLDFDTGVDIGCVIFHKTEREAERELEDLEDDNFIIVELDLKFTIVFETKSVKKVF